MDGCIGHRHSDPRFRSRFIGTCPDRWV